ncbi:MAG: site-specific integrase [Chlorobi bacterium]|nr:site-specific integrase [Chlorobiota bacterium]MCI0716927.1 site-specific integrase [Chlorobiota bacterium]
MGVVKGYKNIWYYRFIQTNGKYTKKSLHTTDRDEAERLSQVFIREHREEMKDFQEVTLHKLRQDFEEYHIKNKPKKTKDNYRIVFNGLENLLGSEFIIKNILPVNIEKYKQSLLDEGKSPATVNSYLRNVRCIFNKAVHKFKYLKENPANEVEFLEDPERLRDFSETEVNLLAENIKNKLIRVVFLIAVYAGLRKGEILHIRWKDIDFTNKTINIINNRAFKTKTRKIRQVPISDELFHIIKEIQFERFGDKENNIINLEDYLLENSYGSPFNGNYISREFKKYLRAFALMRIIIFIPHGLLSLHYPLKMVSLLNKYKK